MSDRRARRPVAVGALLHLLAVAVMAVASGCAILAPDDERPAATAAAQVHTEWRGRFSITVTEPGVEEREEQAQGRYRLSRPTGGRIEIEIASPFGQTIAMLRAGPDGAELSDGKARRWQARSPNALIRDVLGWQLPVEQMADWLATPASAGSEPRDGWQVGVERRFADERPRLLIADWPAEPRIGDRRVHLRLIVDGRGP